MAENEGDEEKMIDEKTLIDQYQEYLQSKKLQEMNLDESEEKNGG